MSVPSPARLDEPGALEPPRSAGCPGVWDVVIVGSGYGGSMASAGLAGSRTNGRPLNVLLLERGQAWRPGEFPSGFAELPAHVRVGHQTSGTVAGNPAGLFDLRPGPDVNLLLANGLGGGSLINAGVLLRPRGLTRGTLLHEEVLALLKGRFYSRARRLLGGTRVGGGAAAPNTISGHPAVAGDPLPKTQRLREMAGGAPCVEVPLSIAMTPGANSAGVQLQACTLCGDCMTGCNRGAKDSLDVNLLARAAAGGVRIVCGATVLRLRRDRPGADGPPMWMLELEHTDPRLQAREARTLRLRAQRVVLAAGALGSTEILLRSRGDRLRFSPRLGERFSCNGDNLSAVTGLRRASAACADDDMPLTARRVGPTITASINVPAQGDRRGFRLQEFAVPGPMRRLFEELVTTAGALDALARADNAAHGAEPPGRVDPLAVRPSAMRRTLLLGTIGHDEACGALALAAPVRTNGRLDEAAQPRGLRVEWPQAGRSPQVHAAFECARQLVRHHGRARLLPNPVWRLLPPGLEALVDQPTGALISVHPLGGCAMGCSVHDGVVDAHGVVFDASPDDEDLWQGTLCVMDGAIVPGSLGANPALTIAALALRAVEHWCVAWKLTHTTRLAPWPGDGVPRPRPTAPPRVPPPVPAGGADTQIELIERLVGRVRVPGQDGVARDCIAELTLAFEPVRVASLVRTLRRTLTVDAGHAQSRLRLYDPATWDELDLRLLSDVQRQQHVLAESVVGGQLALLHREPSGPRQRRLRVFLPWLRNRGCRDLIGLWRDRRERARDPSRAKPRRSGFCEAVRSWCRAATRAGECRRFDYSLYALGFTPPSHGAAPDWLPQGGVIELRGEKRLTYTRRANPWQQLTQMRLLSWAGRRLPDEPVLELDARFLVGQGVPLLRIVAQRDQLSALADLAMLGLLFTRILLHIHLWTFRKPDEDRRARREPDRLPGAIATARGLLSPRVTELVVGHWGPEGEPVRVRLSHYPQPVPPLEPAGDAKPPPLVMVHGYSVSGNTFTHRTLRPSAAEYFWNRGRDVWVVDLRTSSGLPTATRPWAFEDAALVDLPAALMHIRQVAGQPVDVLAHCIGCAMLSMALLTDAREVRAGTTQLGVDTWLTPEQLGALAAFNGEASGVPGPHPVVGRVVLSQKGPMLIYTDGNVLRAYLMQVLRRWLLPAGYQFRAERGAGVASQLLDRLLASLPYPKADYDTENPMWRDTPWTASRHRMDLLYGRDFNAENLRPATLRAIDDLFGPLNLDTLAQTIHFTRFNTITNQRGRGEFVTLRRLRERWGGIPTLLLHGAENGLVDPATQRLLERNFRAAGVPVEAPPPLPGIGHQDLLIGRGARAVFDRIEDFLGANDGRALPDDAVPWRLDLPWLGPRFGPPSQRHAGHVCVHTMGRPDRGASWVVAVPVVARRDAAGDLMDVVLAADAWQAWALSAAACPSGQWAAVTLPVPSAEPSMTGWLVLHAYPAQEAALDLHDAPAVLSARAFAVPALASAGSPPLARLVASWLPEQAREHLALAYVHRRDAERAAGLPDRAGLQLAVASCQYPTGLLDAVCARASLEHLAGRVDREADVDLALFVGDQIYADATAGVLDPTRRDERYDRPHEAALRQRGLRAVLRRLPDLMLLDDHELVDNWEPLPDPARLDRRAPPPGASMPAWTALLPDVPARPRREPFSGMADTMVRTRREGVQAFIRYQRMGQWSGRDKTPPPQDRALRAAGIPIYLADTRTGRDMRRPRSAAYAHILSATQRARLADWLIAHKDQPKIVACPARLLPRLAEAADQRDSDAWDGYPASMAWLLGLLVQESIRHTVFVSGDEHHSFVAEAWLRGPGPAAQEVKIVCVHSSALYAPFVFANGDRAQLAPDGQQDFDIGPLAVRCRTRWSPGDGWARLSLSPTCPPAAPPVLRVEFHKAATQAIAWAADIPLA